MSLWKNEWQLTLKPGDKVLVDKSGEVAPREAVVAKVTPTGRVKTEDGREWNVDGRLRGGSRWNCPYLRQWEPDAAAKAQRVELLNKMKYTRWEDLDLAALEQVFTLVETLRAASKPTP